MACEEYFLTICLVKPLSSSGSSIFGFAQFISALALLVIVYTIADIRYRFRVAIAPLPLFRLTYYLMGTIGFATLLTDIWLREHWLVPQSLISQFVWQGMLGGFFLLLVMTWMYYAFINPPIFCEKNYRKFTNKLYRVILKGVDTDLSVIASELQRSAKSLVEYAWQNSVERQIKGKSDKKTPSTPNVGDYAHDVLLLIGSRKLCRNIVASSPMTAIAFFEAISNNNRYDIPIGQFAKNISTEAIINKDSLLYHEDDGYRSGLLGYVKPFSQAIYSNFWLIESLSSKMGSPLDIHHDLVWSWDASQLKAYSRAVIITLKNYLEYGSLQRHSFALHSVFENIEYSCRDVYKLNDILLDYYSTDIYKRLQTTVQFVNDAIDLIDKQQDFPSTTLRVRDNRWQKDLYDQIADLMFEIIFSATHVTTPPDKCWTIQHNTVWDEFFNSTKEGVAWKIIHFKLRRLLYNEILDLEKFPNYKSSRILGFCLNVMGLKIKDKKLIGYHYYPFHKAVLTWTKKNYLRLKSIQPDVAKSCLMGSISFDEKNNRLVKTYAKGLDLEAKKDYLELDSTVNVPE